MNFKKLLLSFSLLAGVASCSTGTSIFPAVSLSLDESDLTLPNPIDIIPDVANNQIIVVNSNVDYFFNQGSVFTLDVDVTDPAAPQLTASSALALPNFAGEAAFDGVNLFIPFREASADGTGDTIGSFTVASGLVTANQEGIVGDNPYGIALDGGNLYVVNDESLSILDTSLTLQTEIALTTAFDAGITDTKSKYAESVAVDAVGNRLYVSNRNGKVFVVDLTSNEITHVINGPKNSRGIVTDGSRIYLVDGDTPSLWVFDPTLLPAAVTPPEEIDDSVLTVGLVDLGLNPNGIALDTTLNRIYVTNTGEKTVSVIDTHLLQEVARVSFAKEDTGFTEDGKDPFGITAATFGGVPLVFVANFSSNTIYVINANTLNIVERFPNQS